jgi:hypothetical protein
MEFDGNTITHSTLDDGYDFFIKDKWKKNRHFKIHTFPVPSGYLSEAIEVINDKKTEPYIFSILSPFDTDTEYAELQLKAKIKRGVNKRYLEKDGAGYKLIENDEMVGRIEWYSNGEDYLNQTSFIVDGKCLSMEQLNYILETYEGWQFRLQIIDPSEEF